MSANDEIRRMLRAADPATGRELGEVERARMRARIASAQRGTARHRSAVALVATGVAVATIVAAAVVLLPRGERPAEAVVVAPATPPPEPAIVPPPVAASVAPPKRRAKPRPALPAPPGQATRIVFTAPEGTRIIWFVGTPDAKELGS